MSIPIEEILEKDAFKILNPQLLSSIKQLMVNLSGKNIMQAMPMIIDFISKIPEEAKPTEEEKKVIIELLMECLPQNEKDKFNMILKTINH